LVARLGSGHDVGSALVPRFRDVDSSRGLTAERYLRGTLEIARRWSNRDPRTWWVGLNVDRLQLSSRHPHAASREEHRRHVWSPEPMAHSFSGLARPPNDRRFSGGSPARLQARVRHQLLSPLRLAVGTTPRVPRAIRHEAA